MIAFMDLFWVFGIVLFSTIPLVLFLKPLDPKRTAGPAA